MYKCLGNSSTYIYHNTDMLLNHKLKLEIKFCISLRTGTAFFMKTHTFKQTTFDEEELMLLLLFSYQKTLLLTILIIKAYKEDHPLKNHPTFLFCASDGVSSFHYVIIKIADCYIDSAKFPENWHFSFIGPYHLSSSSQIKSDK